MTRRAAPSIVLGVPLDADSAVPLFRQLYDALRLSVLNGRLAPGARLPSTRLLANELGLSRNTVSAAYEQLLLEGYLEAVQGGGTYVAQKLPDKLLQAVRPQAPWSDQGEGANAAPLPRLRDARKIALTPSLAEHALAMQRLEEPGLSHQNPLAFCPALPALEAFPHEVWGRLLGRRWRREPTRLMGHGQAAGYRPLREAIAEYLGTARGMTCTADQIIIVAGAQQALALAARAVLDAGDAVWVEDPGYLGARRAVLAAGGRLVPVPVDAHGLDVDAGRRLGPDARLVCISPSHQFPTGVTMALDRRIALLAWARQRGAWIVEDDYDSEYRYGSRPLASLHGLDGGVHVIYVGTFSKVMFPGLRLAYLVLPPDCVDDMLALRAVSDRHGPLLEQAVLADFIAEGHFGSHLRRMRALYEERRTQVRAALDRHVGDALEIRESAAGLHMVGWLRDGVNDQSVFDHVSQAGVEAIPVSAYRMHRDAESPCGMIIGFACVEAAAATAGAKHLAAAIRAARGR